LDQAGTKRGKSKTAIQKDQRGPRFPRREMMSGGKGADKREGAIGDKKRGKGGGRQNKTSPRYRLENPFTGSTTGKNG